jgi:hypothetical protein
MRETVLAAVRLQAAARGLLVRRQVREMRGLQLVLCPVPLYFATRLRFATWKASISSCVMEIGHGIATSGGELGVYSTDVWGRGCVATHRWTLISAVVLRHRPPRGRLRWSLSRLFSGGYTRAPLSFR